jgi:dihydrodipicolinate synthase/N-acetylneuraminate lyase
MGITRAAWNGWKARARDIGDFQSRLLLTIFYFTVLAPFAVLMRLFGDPLRLRPRAPGTAWCERTAGHSASIDAARSQF